MNNMLTRSAILHRDAVRIGFGVRDLDACLGGGLARGRLHEFFAAAEADCVATTAVGLGLAHLAGGGVRDSRVVWIRVAALSREAGLPYGPGLAMLGFDPDRFVVMAAQDTGMALKAALDVARSGSLAALVLELWGQHRMINLTASRRLLLAAKDKSLAIFMLHTAASSAPSAADTRWQVKGLASFAGAANAPGHPRFELTLLRQRSASSGQALRNWCVEWRREHDCFVEQSAPSSATALSQPVVSVSANRPAGAPEQGLRRAG